MPPGRFCAVMFLSFSLTDSLSLTLSPTLTHSSHSLSYSLSLSLSLSHSHSLTLTLTHTHTRSKRVPTKCKGQWTLVQVCTWSTFETIATATNASSSTSNGTPHQEGPGRSPVRFSLLPMKCSGNGLGSSTRTLRPTVCFWTLAGCFWE